MIFKIERGLVLPVKLGFINNIANDDLFDVIDVVRINIEDQDGGEISRAANGPLSKIAQQTKADISLEFDRISQTDLGGLRKKLFNRKQPHQVFLNEPAVVDTSLSPVDGSQTLTYNGITNPAGAANKATIAQSDDPNLLIGTSEFSTGEYGDISQFGTQVENNGTGSKYHYMFFLFKLTNYLAGTDITKESIERLTLFMNRPEAIDNVGGTEINTGIVVHCKNDQENEFTEIYRQGLTSNKFNTQFAALAPVDGFTSFDDYLDGADFIIFRVRNLNAFETGNTNKLKMDFIELLVNGYGVLTPSSNNFTFRDMFTGAGKTGTVQLNEI